MPRRKPKPEAQPATEKPVEVPVPTTPSAVPPTAEVKPEAQQVQSVAPQPTEGFTIREVTWDEFERFAPAPRREKSKSRIREAFELAASGKVVKIEGLTPAQVRAVLAAVSIWNSMEKHRTGRAPVQAKYDMKAGVVYLAPTEKPEEKKQ
jgi:hypothetical protein